MKKAKIILGATILTASLILAGCTKEGDSAYKIFEVEKKFGDTSYELVDKKTGIHYYFLNTGYGKAITPVIESDGSIRGAKPKPGTEQDKEKQLKEIEDQIKKLENEKQSIENN